MANNLVKLSSPFHWARFAEMLWTFYQNNYMVDIRLNCDDQVILMHQLLLSTFCPNLKSMLENNSFSTEKPLNISIVTNDSELLQKLVEFLYKGEVSVEEIKLDSLRKTAELLGITELVGAIEIVKVANEMAHADSRSAHKRRRKPVKRFVAEEEDEPKERSSDEAWTVKSKKPKSRNRTKNVEKRRKTSKNTSTVADVTETKNRPAVSQKSATAERHKCDICGKDFRNARYFRRHLRQHANDWNYRCERCKYKTMNKRDLTEHLASVHKVDHEGNALQEDVKCELCDFKCVTETRLKAHMVRKHTQKKHKCAQCDYSAVMLCDLRKHVSIVHDNLRPFQCDICGKRSKTKSDSNVHIRSHSGIKPYKCDICGKAYSGAENYRLHIQMHTSDEKKFICGICWYSCRQKGNLKSHMKRIHKIEGVTKKSDVVPVNESISLETSVSLPTTPPVGPTVSASDGQQFGSESSTGQSRVTSCFDSDFANSAASEANELQNRVLLHYESYLQAAFASDV